MGGFISQAVSHFVLLNICHAAQSERKSWERPGLRPQCQPCLLHFRIGSHLKHPWVFASWMFLSTPTLNVALNSLDILVWHLSFLGFIEISGWVKASITIIHNMSYCEHFSVNTCSTSFFFNYLLFLIIYSYLKLDYTKVTLV